MSKFTGFVFVFLLFSIVVGCSPSIVPTVEMFEVDSDELTGIEVNQAFSIDGYLQNQSQYTWRISHGADLFTYEIYDTDGNRIRQEPETLFVDAAGYGSEIKPKTTYRSNGEEMRSQAFYVFKIEKPGQYFIQTTANFRINDEPFEITSHEQKAFIVN